MIIRSAYANEWCIHIQHTTAIIICVVDFLMLAFAEVRWLSTLNSTYLNFELDFEAKENASCVWVIR